MSRLVVFLGTKAQYIKTAPLLRLLDARALPYRLVDSGQHAALARGLRTELGVREPDAVLGGTRDVTTVRQAAVWASVIAARLGTPERLRREVFGARRGDGGVCVVHGDTPSTLLSTLLARRAGLDVAHLEAGLRSYDLLHPFPEELVRLAVMRMSDVLFAPDATAVDNLARMRGLRGTVVPLSGNSVVEALAHALPHAGPPGSGPIAVTMHRVENLRSTARTEQLVDLAVRLRQRGPVRFVAHGPTEEVLRARGLDTRLRAADIDVVPLLPHGAFTRLLAEAPLVVTDGGSVQEECALLGVPALLWRRSTERPDGLDANVVLSGYDPDVVARFLDDPERLRRPRRTDLPSPSAQVVDVLLDRYGPFTGQAPAGR